MYPLDRSSFNDFLDFCSIYNFLKILEEIWQIFMRNFPLFFAVNPQKRRNGNFFIHFLAKKGRISVISLKICLFSRKKSK